MAISYMLSDINSITMSLMDPITNLKSLWKYNSMAFILLQTQHIKAYGLRNESSKHYIYLLLFEGKSAHNQAFVSDAMLAELIAVNICLNAFCL